MDFPNPVRFPHCYCNTGGSRWCPMHGYQRPYFAVVECTCLTTDAVGVVLGKRARIVDPWCGAHGQYVPGDDAAPFQGYEDITT